MTETANTPEAPQPSQPDVPKPERLGVPNLEQTILYERDGTMVEIKMTFGLLNVLLQSVGNMNNVALVGIDPTINDIILRKILTLRDHKGKPIEGRELEDIFDIEVSVYDTERILYFCQSHMVDFTLRAVSRAASLHQNTKGAQTTISNLAAGLIGSLGSVSSKAAL